jgi:hypothetical protein
MSRSRNLDRITTLLGQCLGRIDEQAFRLQHARPGRRRTSTAPDVLEHEAAALQELVGSLLDSASTPRTGDLNRIVEPAVSACLAELERADRRAPAAGGRPAADRLQPGPVRLRRAARAGARRRPARPRRRTRSSRRAATATSVCSRSNAAAAGATATSRNAHGDAVRVRGRVPRQLPRRSTMRACLLVAIELPTAPW